MRPVGELAALPTRYGKRSMASTRYYHWKRHGIWDRITIWERSQSTQSGAWAGLRPTRLTLERLGIDTEVVEAGFALGAWDVPRYTAAHLWPVSAYPRTAGNVIIAGHVGYKDMIFNHLPAAQIGDEVIVFVGDRPHRYIMREVLTLLPQDSWVLLPTSEETLTLITCVRSGRIPIA